MFQKPGAAPTLPSKKYPTQSFIEGPVGARKLARLGGVEEGNGKIAFSPFNNLSRQASGSSKTFCFKRWFQHYQPTLSVSAEKGDGRVRCGFGRNGDGDSDPEEERGRRSRPADGPGFSRTGRGRRRLGDEGGQCGQGKHFLREQGENGQGHMEGMGFH